MDWAVRIPYALAVAAVAAFLVGGVVGFAVAAGEDDGIPLRFSVAEPRVGDRWQYDSRMSMDAPGMAFIEADVLEGGRLHHYWAENGAWLDPEGRYHQVAHLVESWQDLSEEPYVSAYVVAADQDAALAFYENGTNPFSHQWSSGLPFSLGGSGSTTGQTDYYEMTFDGVFEPYCGYRSALQGNEVELVGGVTFLGSCDPGDSLDMPDYPASVVYLPHSVEDLDGMQTVRFHQEYKVEFIDAKLDLWMARHVPYPVKLAYFISFDLRDVAPPEIAGQLPADSMVYVSIELSMTGFEAGHGPLFLDAPLPRDRPVPPIALAARQVWGPDDAGSGHPFPLSQAFQEARDDEGYGELRDFLSRYPDAAVTHGEGWQQQTEDGPEHHWRFQVDDGRRQLVVNARQDPVAPVVQPPILDQQRPRFSTHGVSMGAMVAPDERPALMPTATSALARFAALHGAANTWSVDLSGFGQAGHAVLRAGHREAQVDPPEPTAPVTGQEATSRESLHVLGFDATGRVVLEREETEESTTREEGLLPLQGSAPQQSAPKDPEPVPTTQSGAWAMPEQQAAAGVGIAAALAGILYYLWPLVKAGPAALFSRVHGELLLEHPVRAELMDAVKATPGIHYQQLVRDIGKGRGVVEHHLRKLQQSGFLVAHKTDGLTCYFPKGAIDRRVMAAIPVLKAPTAQLILRAIVGQPGTTQRDIAATLGMAQSTVSHHVRRLVGAGIVERTARGQEMALSPAGVANESLALAAA